MSAMVSITKAQVPDYLVGSEFYKNLSAEDDDGFCIPQKHLKPTVSVTNADDLAHLFHTMKFWGLSRLPIEIIDILVFNLESFADEERAPVSQVLCEFNAEFGLFKLHQNLHECINEKMRIAAAIQCGREDVLEFVFRQKDIVNVDLVNAAAQNGLIRLLKLTLDKYLKLSRKNSIQDVSVVAVASRGRLECLRFLLEKGYNKQKKDICAAAAKNGYLDCLKLAHEHGCALNNAVRDVAAQHGHLDCLKYTLEQGCVADTDATNAAALGGQLRCLQYLLDQGATITPHTCECAVTSGNLECLKLLRARGAPAWHAECATRAADKGHLSCLTYLLDEGCEATYKATYHAAEAGHDDCLELLLARKCEARSECVDLAAEGGHVACLTLLKRFNIPVTHHLSSDESGHFEPTLIYVSSLHETGYEVPQSTILHAVKSSNVECVEYICTNRLCPLTSKLTAEAAKCSDALPILKILYQFNCPWGADTCQHAAEICDIESLQFAHEHGAPWDERTTQAAIQRNGLACLKYALDHKCPFVDDACDIAASRGLCEILQCLHEHGAALTLKTCVAAAMQKDTECLIYAVTHGAPVDTSVCVAAVTPRNLFYNNLDDSLRMLECAHALGCPWDAATVTAAARANGVQLVSFALQNGCPCDVTACVAAANRRNLQILQLLHEHGCPWDERVSEAAVLSRDTQCLQYCIENGCPVHENILKDFTLAQALQN